MDEHRVFTLDWIRTAARAKDSEHSVTQALTICLQLQSK